MTHNEAIDEYVSLMDSMPNHGYGWHWMEKLNEKQKADYARATKLLDFALYDGPDPSKPVPAKEAPHA
jgi:hypothetical protein